MTSMCRGRQAGGLRVDCRCTSPVFNGFNAAVAGIPIFLSVALSAVFFAYAFVSIWCFLAAVLSAYVVYIARYEASVENRQKKGLL